VGAIPSTFTLSLWRSSYVAPSPNPQGVRGSKTQNGRFRLNRTSLEESLLQSFFASKLSATKLYKAFIGYLPCIHAKMVGGGNPFYMKFWVKPSKWPCWSEIAHSVSAVRPSEKSSINTNRKSTTRFAMSPRWTSYVVPKPTKRWLKNAVSKIWKISCDYSETVRDTMPVTVNH